MLAKSVTLTNSSNRLFPKMVLLAQKLDIGFDQSLVKTPFLAKNVFQMAFESPLYSALKM
jgi:hypothetical protein